MKKQNAFLLFALFASSLACQSLLPDPKRNGTVISNCGDILTAVENVHPGKIPDHLLDTGEKQGNEFDVNEYFNALAHLSMRQGYTLDYVYQTDSLGAFPRLYARSVDQAPYTSVADIPENIELPDFREYLEVGDTEQGYFEYVVMDIMAGQFYLSWHANYNDTEIVCNRDAVNEIISRVNADDFGNDLSFGQQAKARGIKKIEPVVSLAGDVAKVEVVTFTKWGGFYRLTYTIRREGQPKIIDVQQEDLVPYDCGVMF